MIERPSLAAVSASIDTARREVQFRARNYPAWIKAGRLDRDVAEAEQNGMRGVVSALEYLEKLVRPGLSTEAARLAVDLRLDLCRCTNYPDLVRAAMSTGGRLGLCLACRAADALERSATRESL